MDRARARARALAEQLLSAAPPEDDPILLDQTDDYGWVWVIQWTTREALETGQPPPPGIGPVAVDKADGAAFYLSSQPLSVALDHAKRERGK